MTNHRSTSRAVAQYLERQRAETRGQLYMLPLPPRPPSRAGRLVRDAALVAVTIAAGAILALAVCP